HSGDADTLRARYERLRAAVLSGEAGGWRLGHGVLSARGMAWWMSEFEGLAPAAPAGTAAAPAPPSSPDGRGAPAGRPVSPADADRVVAVLAQMTLAIAA
ncbi:MAG: hypothetical protein LC790_17645, partial [Actinobacteria bacterium]|nr:hypothetical protein [Actinomycetota bacterium]